MTTPKHLAKPRNMPKQSGSSAFTPGCTSFSLFSCKSLFTYIKNCNKQTSDPEPSHECIHIISEDSAVTSKGWYMEQEAYLYDTEGTRAPAKLQRWQSCITLLLRLENPHFCCLRAGSHGSQWIMAKQGCYPIGKGSRDIGRSDSTLRYRASMVPQSWVKFSLFLWLSRDFTSHNRDRIITHRHCKTSSWGVKGEN